MLPHNIAQCNTHAPTNTNGCESKQKMKVAISIDNNRINRTTIKQHLAKTNISNHDYV